MAPATARARLKTLAIPTPHPHGLPREDPVSASHVPVRGTRDGRLGWLTLALVVAAVVAGPLLLRAAAGLLPARQASPSYLPALEAEYVREVPFDPQPIDDLKRLKPRWIFIGDSMLGTRIDATQLAVATGNRGLAMLAHAGSGSAFWYLALKNWVIASNVKPKYVFVFFRDENMTDPLFRATGTYRWSLDRVARSHEAVLNDIMAQHTAGPWFRVHQTVDQTFRVAPVAKTVEASLRAFPSQWFARTPDDRVRFEERMNGLFELDRLRPIAEADMQKADEARLDFNREVGRSVLPEMARLAELNQFTLVLVRVQRRPQPDGPPIESPALEQYVADLRRWAAEHKVLFQDDTGARELTLAMYEDGDHIDRAYRSFYTDWFRRTMAPVFE